MLLAMSAYYDDLKGGISFYCCWGHRHYKIYAGLNSSRA